MRRVAWGVVGLVVAVCGGCAKSEAPVEPAKVADELLMDVSFVPLGTGLDRAKDQAAFDCFVREMDSVQSVQRWQGAGFTAWTSHELDVKLRTATEVGLQVDSIESQLGSETKLAVGESGETPYFVALLRYVARDEWAGAIRGAGSRCQGLGQTSGTGLEVFVSTCGDSSLGRKTFGGHVILSWRRDPARPAVDSAMASMLGAAAVGATFDPIGNLRSLYEQGLGSEQLVIETFGMPLAPPSTALPSGVQVISVRDAYAYLKDVWSQPYQNFTRTVSHEPRAYVLSDIEACLDRPTGLAVDDWQCIRENLSSLIELRDGVAQTAFEQAQYEQHKLALERYLSAGRVVFATVPQSRCPGQDDDGDPDFEKSGACQAKLLDGFIQFYERCTNEASISVDKCRAPAVLGHVSSCRDFTDQGCGVPEWRLSNGQTVKCDSGGLSAALGDVVRYDVRPPFTPQTSPAPVVEIFQFSDARQGPVRTHTTATHFCAVTGVSGALHEATFGVVPLSNGAWHAFVGSAQNDPSTAVILEVSCVEWSAFTRFSGGTARWVTDRRLHPTNGRTTGAFAGPGAFTLSGMELYLSEPQTTNVLEDFSGGSFFLWTDDAFPFASSVVTVGHALIEGGRTASGAPPAGTVTIPTINSTAYGVSAQIDYVTRDAVNMAADLSSTNAFCFFTGVSGHFYNRTDRAWVDRSDGRRTLRTATPLIKDRNPGAQAQCVLFDSP
ncbi:MAG: hypothetical protein ACO1OB_30295 [Archangium sp.]